MLSEINTKIIAARYVSFTGSVWPARGPNTVSDPGPAPPPKAPAKPVPLPFCKSTINTSPRHAGTYITSNTYHSVSHERILSIMNQPVLYRAARAVSAAPAATMAAKLSTSSDAPPTSAPSTSGRESKSAALSRFTDPPY